MKRSIVGLIMIIALAFVSGVLLFAQPTKQPSAAESPDSKLAVVWTKW